MKDALCALLALALLWPLGQATAAEPKASQRPHFADYDAELRRADGRVDTEAMVRRLQQLRVNTYYWLVWHAATDWDDLKLFLPQARKANINVWVYLVPPSEGSGTAGPPSQPFGLDFKRWAQEIARLSLRETNLTAWVIDDFYANHELLTPAFIGEMQKRAKALNPHLSFLPLMYFNEIDARFVAAYRPVIDGVVVAYLQDREEIERTWAFMNDAPIPSASDVVFPWNTPSQPGDFAMASQSATVLRTGSAGALASAAASRCIIHFRERDDFTGPTTGYHFKQVLVNGTIVWEEDVAGGSPGWRQVNVDATDALRSATNATVAFRLLDKNGVSNFGVRWQIRDLRAENLRFTADLAQPQNWTAKFQGPFQTGFGHSPSGGQRLFHVPFISMTAGDIQEFKLRHGDPPSPERVADWLRMSLQAWKDGRCDGVVTYCLDKSPQSATFPLAQKLFREFSRGTER